MAIDYYKTLLSSGEDEENEKVSKLNEKVNTLYGIQGIRGIEPIGGLNVQNQKTGNSNLPSITNGFNRVTLNAGNTLTDSLSSTSQQRREGLLSKTNTSYDTGTNKSNDTGSNSATSESNIVNAAKKYLGTPYVWGGESMAEGGMDCSGFVYNALKDAGYKVGRTTAQGYRGNGKTVSKSEMQPGDLIFFGSGGSATHIGIYVGNGQMIHSSGGKKNTKSNPGKGVSYTSVNSRNDFIEARRY